MMVMGITVMYNQSVQHVRGRAHAALLPPLPLLHTRRVAPCGQPRAQGAPLGEGPRRRPALSYAAVCARSRSARAWSPRPPPRSARRGETADGTTALTSRPRVAGGGDVAWWEEAEERADPDVQQASPLRHPQREAVVVPLGTDGRHDGAGDARALRRAQQAVAPTPPAHHLRRARRRPPPPLPHTAGGGRHRRPQAALPPPRQHPRRRHTPVGESQPITPPSPSPPPSSPPQAPRLHHQAGVRRPTVAEGSGEVAEASAARVVDVRGGGGHPAQRGV